MKTSNKQHILFRYLVVIAVILLFSAAIIYNMLKISIVEAKAWNDKADGLLKKETVLPPERGRLLSDNGSVLAANLNYYTARIDWSCEVLRTTTSRTVWMCCATAFRYSARTRRVLRTGRKN